MLREPKRGSQPLLATRLSAKLPPSPGHGRYDEVRQLSVDVDGNPLVESLAAGSAGTETITKAALDPTDNASPWLGALRTFSALPAPDPSDPLGNWLSPIITISRTSNPDPADPSDPSMSHLETATRTSTDSDRPTNGQMVLGNVDDLATGVVAF